MSACFGYFSVFFLGDFRDEPYGFVLMVGAAVVLAGIAFLLGREAKRRLSSGR
jgi:drug/metabolite transporter (DMT)-like permease